ncbi:ATP-dependent protease [Mangrovactinospora gilvigrisea]|uniref:ATP-dependent protease n=1 Tax=Mangrovactinospora gilvigrisea TaxID=1428644 RepID=A0A1J7BDS7_9ACTN|nr:LON peptidase substrate-binding domain-containing protein [Mangrovactinospora gilvigrisea]OIV36798.1 ATP-dependent protease [Mangrovactinospora gilvigrisea]
MSLRLPLFPLNTVLYPGLVLPLRVFERRYRRLVEDLMDLSADTPRRFGVVALRGGHEVAPNGPDEAADESPTAGFGTPGNPMASLYAVGCVAEIASVQKEDEEVAYELVTSGTVRFALNSVDASGDYLVGEGEELPEVTGSGAAALVPGVASAFREYQRRLASARERTVAPGQELPDDPKVLSYLVAAATVLEVHEKQALLVAGSAAARLEAELSLLRREAALVAAVPSLPAVDLPDRTLHLN